MADATSVVNIRFPRPARIEAAGTTRIYLLGKMQMIAPAGGNILPRLRKTRALLAYLCLAEEGRVPRSRLIGLLWDRSPDAQGRMSLRHSLGELSKEINTRIPELIKIDRESIRLNTGACWIDALAVPVDDRPGRLLDEFDGISEAFDQWLAAERVRFEDRQRQALERILDQLIKDAALPQLRADAARRLVDFEPTHELAVRNLMTACVEMGDRPQAIREYERCRQALRARLDLPPSRETAALYEAIRIAAAGQAVATSVGGSRASRNAPHDYLAARPRPASAPIEQGNWASIAVLPFRNLSRATPHDHAGGGLVEDLIEVLSRVPNVFVISRLSSLAIANQSRPPREIGEALGVDYLLSGSVRVFGDRLRINAELTDPYRGIALWSSRHDERFTDLLDAQYRIADEIVRRVAPHIHAAELKRIRVKRAEDLAAYELFLRAQEAMHNSSRLIFDDAERLFDEAIEREPGYAAAFAWRAYWHVLRVGQGWSPNPAHDTAQAEYFAQRAIDCDSLEPMAFAVRGHIASYLHADFKLAFDCFETALQINPNAAPAWLWSAAARAWKGNGTRAIEEINRAIALSPYDPLMYAYSMIAGLAYLTDHQCERAIEFAARSMRENRTYTSAYKLMISALGMAGRETEARATVRQLLELEPGFTVEQFRLRSPTMASPLGAAYCDALARAGVPLAS